MQKTSAFANDYPQRDRSETERLHGDASRHETCRKMKVGENYFVFLLLDYITVFCSGERDSNKFHSYTKIELLDSPGKRDNPDSPPLVVSNNSISGCKVT